MPAKLPVPSKGALRTLRHLALGTTCTLALSAGLLTEDRRRRIHTARVVHKNCRKLKEAKNYHGLATDLQDVANDPAIVFKSDSMMRKLTKETNQSLMDGADANIVEGGQGLWLELEEEENPTKDLGQVPNKTSHCLPPSKSAGEGHPDNIADQVSDAIPNVGNQDEPAQKKSMISVHQNHISTNILPIPKPRMDILEPLSIPTLSPILESNVKVDETPETQLQDRQKRVASDVIKLLGCVEDSTDLDAAALRFLEAFEEGYLATSDSGLVPELLDAAFQLSKACKDRENIEYLTKILDTVLPYSESMDAAQFLLFSPHTVIKHSLDDFREKEQTKKQPKWKLKKLSSIYLKTANNNEPADMEWELPISNGEGLCEATSRYGLYDFTCDIYQCLVYYCSKGARTATPPAIGHFINANYRLGRHKDAIRYFKQIYSKVSATVDEFDMVISRVTYSAVKLDRLGDAEYILFVAVKMGKASGLPVPTTPLLRVITRTWNYSRDLQKVTDLVDRFVPRASSFRHPQAIYQAIIQVCIDANREDVALSYYAQLRRAYAPTSEDQSIYGQFAYAKALRNDWIGVKEDLIQISSTDPILSEKFGASLAPILKLFVKAHSIQETEEFIGFFVRAGLLKFSPFLSNIMIDIYCKAKEMDALFRWIELMSSVRCPIDTVSVNIILHHSYTTWRFSFQEVQVLYQKICACGGVQGLFTGKENLDYLAQLARGDSPNPERLAERLLPLSVLGKQEQTWDTLGVHRAISATHKNKDPLATFKIYTMARADNIEIRPGTLAMAALACIKTQGRENAMMMIKEAQDRGDDISHAIANCLTWHVMHVKNRSPFQLLDLVENTIASLEESGTRIDQGLLAGTMTMLVRRGKAQLAIDFWNNYSPRLRIPQSRIETPTLTTLMHAYIKSQSPQGISWIRNLLDRTGIVPNRRFLNTVNRHINDMALFNPDRWEGSRLLYELNRLRLRVLLIRAHDLEEKRRFKSTVLRTAEAVSGTKYKRKPRRLQKRPGNLARRRKIGRERFLASQADLAKDPRADAGSGEIASANPVPKELPKRFVPLLERKQHRPSANDRYKITSHSLMNSDSHEEGGLALS